jgi:hypothetical protein
MRRTLVLVAALMVISMGTPKRARAFVDVGQGDWISGQNSLLLQQLFTQIEQLSELGTAVHNIKKVVRTTNEGLSVARAAYNEYKTLSNLSWDDLLYDAKAGFYKAFPDMKYIEKDFREIQTQGKYIADGQYGKFWTYYGDHDANVTNALRRMAEWGYKQTIWPHVFPEITSMSDEHNYSLSHSEMRIWQMYHERGEAASVAIEKTAWGAFAKKVADYREQAKEKENLSLQMQADQLAVQTKAAADESEHLRLVKLKAAANVKAKDAARRSNDIMMKALEENKESFFGLEPK